ncbi:hypothetical protein CLCR_00963 [Cladophialophora carrionii]|uniref:U6 snRNA-associated Sm-like protein LSm6 n=1 Tax=Cladophialophora carrionii TaxID=86049 RepID=A0A1C1D131_9EURO|nr:hypothetical protein CLCR_00963 [Cladophialophora carrionii]
MAENHTTTSTTSASASASADPKDPASFLSSIIGVPVTVKLNSGVVYKGELQSVDGYMNIALEKCAEYVEGKLRRRYGDAFVRGNNEANIWMKFLDGAGGGERLFESERDSGRLNAEGAGSRNVAGNYSSIDSIVK